MKKRLLCLLLIVCMVFTLMPINAFAQTIVSGDYHGGEGDGRNLTWRLDPDGVLTISGQGEMQDYGWTNNGFGIITTAPWASVASSIREVVIDDGVTSVGYGAFSGCKNLQSVKMADTVIRIEIEAFFVCDNLTELKLSNNLNTIRGFAFAGCTSLKTVEIPDSVKKIEECAFNGCYSLTNVIIGKGLTKTGNNVFGGCSQIKNVIIPDNIISISSGLFAACNSLKTVTIPNSVTSIGSDAFLECDGLTDVYFSGTEREWKSISIGNNNEKLLKATIHYNCVGFADVSVNSYYSNAVLWASEKNITSGTDAKHFSPNAPCTRAQVVTFLWRAYGCPKVSEVENPFKDVNPGDYYYDAVMWALKNDITTGTDANHFSPKKAVTRAQTVTFMWRADGEISVESQKSFKDVTPGDYYYEAVMWALGNGITNGLDTNHFGPNSGCTRGQIVTFLYRLMNVNS